MRPYFLPGARDRRTHRPATKPADPRSGSRFDWSTAWPLMAGAWTCCNTAVAANALLAISREEWGLGIGLAIGSTLSAMACVAWTIRTVSKADEREKREQDSARQIRDAHERRLAVKAQLATMSPHDPRRGKLQEEMKSSMFVVLGGGRA